MTDVDLFGHRKPKSLRNAMTSAQRQSRYRQSELERFQQRAERFAKLSDVTIARYMADGQQQDEYRKDLWLEFGRRQGWK